MSAHAPIPQINRASCVHSLLLDATCRACADACPCDALTEGESGGFEPDPDTCTSCGACVAACTEIAISLPLPARDRALRVEGASLTLVCDRHPAAKDGDALPCLHSFGLADLALAWAAGLRRIRIAAGNCDTCDICPPDRLEQRIGQFNVLAHSRGVAAITHHVAGPKALRRWHVDHAQESAPHQGRRAFLRAVAAPVLVEDPEPQDPGALVAFLQRISPEMTPLFPFAPQIDLALCSACDACTRVCPHDALILINDKNNEPAYAVAGSACTCCGLCVDICEEDAIAVATMTGPKPDLPLTRFRCKACGNWQHSLEPSPPEGGYCRICRVNNSRRNLFVTLP